MAQTLTNLQQDVRKYLDESSQSDWTDTEVLADINYAYQDVIGKVMEVYEGYYETTTPYTYAMVANQQEYLIDSAILKVTRVEINYTPANASNKPMRAIRSSMDEVLVQLNNSAYTGNNFSNPAYYLHGAQDSQYLGFIPIPGNSDTGNTKSISVWAIAAPSNLSQTTDSVKIPYADRFAKLISLKAAAELIRKGQQDETASNRYIADYGIGIVQMQTYLKERQQDGVWMIEESGDAIMDFQESGW